jgi:predicted nucleic acid-binding Zn ribbon protein
MIKEIKTQQEVIAQHKYCNVCGAEIAQGLACSNAPCEYCRKDLCEKCIGHEDET